MKKIIGLVTIIALLIGVFQLLRAPAKQTPPHTITVIYSPFNKICDELNIHPLPVKEAKESDWEVGFIVKGNNEPNSLVIRGQKQIKLIAAWIKKDGEQKLTALFTDLDLLFQLLENSKNYVSKKERRLASEQIRLVSMETFVKHGLDWLETHSANDILKIGDREYDYTAVHSDADRRIADCKSLRRSIELEQQMIKAESQQITATEKKLQAIKQDLEDLGGCLKTAAHPSELEKLWYTIDKIHFKKVARNSQEII